MISCNSSKNILRRSTLRLLCGCFRETMMMMMRMLWSWQHHQVMTLSSARMSKALSRIKAHRAAGPDNIPGRVLKDFVEELTDVLTGIFNTPTSFKNTTIIPVPKKASPPCFNDWHPVALTPIIIKSFEQLNMQYITSVLRPSLHPYQFAYRANWSTEDAISTTLHLALTHLDTKDSWEDPVLGHQFRF